jgi:hypothetical protein
MSLIRVTLEARFNPPNEYPHQVRLGGCDAMNWHRFLTWAACQAPESQTQDEWFCFRHANDALRFRAHVGDKTAKPAPMPPVQTGPGAVRPAVVRSLHVEFIALREIADDEFPFQAAPRCEHAEDWYMLVGWCAENLPDMRHGAMWFCFRTEADRRTFVDTWSDPAKAVAATPEAITQGKPMKITSDDCKRFLTTLDTPFMDRTERVSGLTRNKTWVRLRKYKDAQGAVCRDFANTGIPVVAVLAETPTGLMLKRMRALGRWEGAFEKHFDAWSSGANYRSAEAWESTVMWMSFRPEDFAFGITVGEVTDTPNGHSYFFQPVTTSDGNGWDQHSAIDFLFPRTIRGDEMCESTFVFTKGGQDEADVTADLLAAGFVHDKSLDNISGS